MAHLKFIFFPCLLLSSSLFIAAMDARTFSYEQNLVERLQSGGVMECWDSLMQLRSCTGEVVLFFLNGEAYLGPSCCRALHTIENQCWPSMLTSLGFTPEEGDVLRGYCDASEAGRLNPPPSSPGPTFEGLVH